MLLFHFINEHYGLDDLRRRRLKISQIHDLNDPFELLSIELSNKVVRQAFYATKDQLAADRGVLCFSKKSSNPVQWSHYADKHRGLCLGFDIADELTMTVSYKAKRLIADAERLLTSGGLDEEFMQRLLTTKFAHWKYEHEVRCFLALTDKDQETGLYFADFSNRIRLVQVIVGARSTVSRKDLADAVGDLARHTRVVKARLAFKSFAVVRNRDESLWS